MEFRSGDETAMGLDLADTATAGGTETKPAAKKKVEQAAVTMDRKDGGDTLVVEQAAAEAMAEALKVAAQSEPGPEVDSKAVRARRRSRARPSPSACPGSPA